MKKNVRLLLIVLVSLLPSCLLATNTVARRLETKSSLSNSQSSAAAQAAPGLPKVTHYSLKLRVFPKERQVSVAAQLKITNNTGEPQAEIPLILYRLLEVGSVTDESGQSLKFSQSILGFSDRKNEQANFIKIQLARPLLPDKSLRLNVNYDGSIFGYPEVLAYVRDTISESFSLIRPDTYAYPMLAVSTNKSVHAAYDTSFTYDLETTVPADYTVASGGALTATTKGAVTPESV